MSDVNETNTARQLLESGQPMFQYNGRVSNINIDNALAAILDKFDDNFIMDAIDYSIDHRFRPYDQPMPNVVYGYEQQFVILSEGFVSNQQDISETRYRTYMNIINRLCEKHNFRFNNSDELDYYSAAFYLYKFLIAEFTNNIITFYTNFLIRERAGIYNSLNLKDLKKNETGMVYSNQLFKDEKLGMIHGNIGYVMENISAFDIDLYNILDLIYADKNISRYIYGLVEDAGNFFKDFYSAYVTDLTYGAELQTQVKLNLQLCAGQLSGDTDI